MLLNFPTLDLYLEAACDFARFYTPQYSIFVNNSIFPTGFNPTAILLASLSSHRPIQLERNLSAADDHLACKSVQNLPGSRFSTSTPKNESDLSDAAYRYLHTNGNYNWSYLKTLPKLSFQAIMSCDGNQQAKSGNGDIYLTNNKSSLKLPLPWEQRPNFRRTY